MSETCPHCENMPEGYYCQACGMTGEELAKRRGKPSDFEFQWYVATVRIIATEPAVLYRHGPRKGEPKRTPVEKVLHDSLTHYYNCEVQGIRNAAACESIVRESYATIVRELESVGYTGVRVIVRAFGVTFG